MSSEGRRTQALKTARELVEAFEGNALPIEQCLMKAQRLARLLRDEHAQTWLDLEMRGYPKEAAKLPNLGPCATYVFRYLPDGELLQPSLPALESQVKAAEIFLGKMQPANISAPTENFIASRSTQTVIGTMTKVIVAARDNYSAAASVFTAQKSHLYRYAVDTLISLELGDVAEDVFQSARRVVDEFVRTHAPKAVEQLLAANERMQDGNAEGLSACLTSCRRVLTTVADALFPPRDEPLIDSKGKSRKVGSEHYLNRLLAYLEARIASVSTRSILEAQIGHLSARLDALHDKACKGVHDEVAVDEARLVLIQTYLFLAEVARVSAIKVVAASAPPIDVSAASAPPVEAPAAPVAAPSDTPAAT